MRSMGICNVNNGGIMKSVRFLMVILFLFICDLLAAGSHKLTIKVDTGFFERNNVLLKTNIDFKKATDLKSLKLTLDGKKVPVFIIPGTEFNADMYWVLTGKIPSMTQKEYTLVFSDGDWTSEPIGPADLKERVQNETNVVPNHSFENVDTNAKQSTNWHGEQLPKEWVIKDFAWHYRKLPNIASICRVTEQEAYDGKRSLVFKSELRKEKDKNGKRINLIGYALSSIFPLKPDTEYSFVYYFKFVDLTDNEGKYQGVSASVNFLDKDKKRIYPRNYGLNRLQNAYSTVRHPKDSYFKKWTKTEYRKKTPSNVRFGQIYIGGSFTGTMYIDDLVVKECGKAGKPVKIEVGESVSQ